MRSLIVDLFAGGGGASRGIESATGRDVDIAINHSATALAVHQANHPRTRHLTADIWEVKPKEAVGGLPVDILWASPDCTHFSVAKGGKPRKQNIRSLAWAVVRWARDVRPRVIFLENVAEFRGWGPLDEDGRPNKLKAGETFKRWKRDLERLGYVVDYRVLDASHFGAPTKRRRLFLVARCDGRPIRWPEPTHGPGLKPFHTAAECIDWSLACPSIFERKKPLAEKTLARIALGMRKYVFEAASPFIVKVNHGGDSDRSEDLHRPLSTVTAARRGHALVAPTMVQTGYGERVGQTPRALDLGEPLGTVVAGGSKHALIASFLAKHYGGNTTPGSSHAAPMDTITTQDHHALVTSNLLKLRGECHGAAVDEPMPTITAAGTHIAEVRAFLMTYYGSGGQWAGVDSPMRTVTTKDRLGLVTVEGTEYQVVDIGMRMLEPHELLRAQFGRFAETYDLSRAKSKADKVRLIGNSVCPEVAEAVVAANVSDAELAAA